MGLIFFLSAQSRLPHLTPLSVTLEHKLGHVVFYGILAGMVMWALRRGHGLRMSKSFALSVLVTAAYGASDEWHQTFVPGRDGQFSDVVIDTNAGAIGAAVYCIWILSRARNARTPAAAPDIGQHVPVTRTRRTAMWLPVLLWGGLIFFLSAQSKLPEVGPVSLNEGKIEHFIFYSIFWFCLLLPLRYGHRLTLAKAIVLAFLITSAYGASDEFHQRFVPGRSCDVLDWAADTFGGFIAASAYWVYETRGTTKKNR